MKKGKPYSSAAPFFKNMLKDREIRVLYEEVMAKQRIAMAVKAARTHAHLTQAELARRVHTNQSAIARTFSRPRTRKRVSPRL